MKRPLLWRLKHIVHNCLAHPLLPLAEALDSIRCYKAADVIFTFHDATSPEHDEFNRVKYLN